MNKVHARSCPGYSIGLMHGLVQGKCQAGYWARRAAQTKLYDDLRPTPGAELVSIRVPCTSWCDEAVGKVATIDVRMPHASDPCNGSSYSVSLYASHRLYSLTTHNYDHV